MIGWAALLYLAATLAIGFWAKRRTRGAADFFVAGRALGLGVVVLATMSTAFSGFAFIGGPGLVYRMGVSSLTICLSVGFTAALLVWTAGGRLARLAAARETLTLADALAARFASPLPGAAAAVATVVGSIGYLGAQALALGLAIQGAFGLEARLGDASLPVATAIGVAILVVYTVAGGMVASAWTDVLQGGIMLVCGVGVCAVALGATGGLSGMLDSIATSDAPHLSVMVLASSFVVVVVTLAEPLEASECPLAMLILRREPTLIATAAFAVTVSPAAELSE